LYEVVELDSEPTVTLIVEVQKGPAEFNFNEAGKLSLVFGVLDG
jgi:hypothetical protein